MCGPLVSSRHIRSLSLSLSLTRTLYLSNRKKFAPGSSSSVVRSPAKKGGEMRVRDGHGEGDSWSSLDDCLLIPLTEYTSTLYTVRINTRDRGFHTFIMGTEVETYLPGDHEGPHAEKVMSALPRYERQLKNHFLMSFHCHSIVKKKISTWYFWSKMILPICQFQVPSKLVVRQSAQEAHLQKHVWRKRPRARVWQFQRMGPRFLKIRRLLPVRYKVTIHIVSNLPLTLKQRLRFSTWASY